MRAPKPLVICNGIPVNLKWQLVSIDCGINLRDRGLFKLFYRYEIWHRCILGHSESLLLRYNSLPGGTECYLRRPQASANVQEKWTHNTGKMTWNRDDPSSDVAMYFLFLVGHNMEYTHFYCKERDLNFIWIYLSLDTETTSVSLFYNIESYFVTIHRSIFNIFYNLKSTTGFTL